MYWTIGSVDKERREDRASIDQAPAIDEEFREGSVRLRTHLRKERHWRLAKLKKEEFIGEHGKLTCERCGFDPEQIYGSPLGNSAIEVHHVNPVSEMKPNTKVGLSDLQCLCANCHRVAHAELRDAERMSLD
jgi:5-methylcytosine-specific restriction protein A